MEVRWMKHAIGKWKAKLASMLALAMLVGLFPAIGMGITSVQASGSGNLLNNGGYETVNGTIPSQWSTWVSSGSPVFSVDESVYKGGRRSFKITAATASRGTLLQVIPLTAEQKGKNYKLSQWIKTANVTGSGAFNRMFFTSSSGSRVGDLIELPKLTGTQDWTLVEHEISIPDDPAIAGIKVENFFETGTGEAWFDDAVFQEIVPDPDRVVNGGFEEAGSNGKPTGWGTWIPVGTPTIELGNSQYHSGASSVRVEATSTGRAALVQNIQLSPADIGGTFKVESWIKTQDLTGSALTRLQFVNSSGTRAGDLVMFGSVSGTQDWTKLEKVVQVPVNLDIVYVKIEHFFEQGTGTAWFDDTKFMDWVPLQGIVLSSNQLTMSTGDTQALTVNSMPSNASDPSVTWSSSHPQVATVQDGIVTAHAEGLAVVTATSNDGGLKASATVIVGQSDTITAEDASAVLDENGSAQGQVNATSTTGSTLSYWVLTTPAQGIAHVTADGAWSYYPNENVTGADEFIIAVEDTNGGFAISRISLQINGVNAPPVGEEGIHPTDKNTPVQAKVSATDADGDSLLYSMLSNPQHGSVTLAADGKWTYTPNTDYTGADQFTVSVSDGNGGLLESIMRVYTAPTSEEIIASLKAANPQNQHPRILATASDFQRMRDLVDVDARFTGWFNSVKEEADLILPQPVKDYDKPDGLRLDTTSSRRIVTLAFAYQLTGDAVYADRAWQELAHVSSSAYPDWSPGHYLDTATMTYGVGIGYDWLYDYMTQEQRDTVRQAIVDKGLTPAVPMYVDKTYWWVYNRDNWNFVCNAGMTIGALAIADEEEQLAGLILREAFKSIQYGLPQYAPDGSAKEGPSYWEYGVMYLLYFLSGLETTFGHDYGFSSSEGLAETPLYPIHVAGTEGAFNYFDNSEALIPGRTLLWFAKHDNKPEYTWYHQFAEESGRTGGLYDALWYRPELYGANAPQELDRKFEIPEAVTMRSDWDDPGALFAGFKGGMNGAPHGDLDTGTFVLDAHGVRWALDIGSENYNLPGYWNMSENGQRWTYYRKRAEGHNTLIISPSAGPDQDVDSLSPITTTSFNETGGAYAISDLTPAYQKQAASIKRGVALIDERRQFLVQDEIVNKSPSELYWFMHTRASIEISPDGTSAMLSQDGRQLYVKLLTPGNASFSVMDAVPLPISPNPSGQTSNYGVKKLTIHMEDVLNETISVWMVPLMPGETPPSVQPAVVPLESWSVQNGQLAKLSGLTVDGVALEEFDSNRYMYELSIPASETSIPVIGATAAGSYSVQVQQASGIPGYAKIVVTDPQGTAKTTSYYVTMEHPVTYGIPDNRPIWQPQSVTASDDDGNVPENTMDNNTDTRWSAAGEQWIQYDLGESRQIGAISAAFYNGNIRSSYFKIEVSEDGQTWYQVLEGNSSGESVDHELFAFPEQSGRYVRITGFGNNQNHWNSYTEVKIYGSPVAPTLAEVSLTCSSCDPINRKDKAELQVMLKLSNGTVLDPSQVALEFFTTNYKVAKVVDGMVHTQKTGEADIWVEATHDGNTITSEPLHVRVIKKNGHGSDDDDYDDEDDEDNDDEDNDDEDNDDDSDDQEDED
ncbi:Ig-like domain-containing protein [Paenibacillus sp. J5C_2022]|nr:Ig-like domain-containing protein [Paenibacillus sp. J5C2022]